METGGTLTWHQGSIPPYTSLWFTLMRVAALNRLSPAALNELLYEPGEVVPVDFRKAVLSDSLGRLANTQRLASFLGEPDEIFRWSQLGSVPPWMRRLVFPQHRICVECARVGYHSSLYSLKFLEVCPIHGCGFISTCLCGEKFPDRLTERDCLMSGSCGCGRFQFLSKVTCRVPAVKLGFTRPLDAVARWLDGAENVIRSPYPESDGAVGQLPRWTGLMRQWSRTLDIPWPNCFNLPDEPERPIVVTNGGLRPAMDLRQGMERFRAASDALEFVAHLKIHDSSYSSFSRYLRQHVAIDSHKWIRKFQRSADPIEIAGWMEKDQSAFLAFAYMLWVHETDSSRTWDFNPTKNSLPHPSRTSTSPSVLQSAAATRLTCERDDPVEQRQVNWIREHHTMSHLRDIWAMALERASQAVRSQSANWRPIRQTFQRPELIARREKDGTIDLLELRIARQACKVELPARDGKATRVAAQERRMPAMMEQLLGEVLEKYFTQEDEIWSEVSPLLPDGVLLRRRRLMDSGFHPHPFWLFSSGEDFVARSRLAPLQFSACTPAAAIARLREGTIAYIVKNKIKLVRYKLKSERKAQEHSSMPQMRRLIEHHKSAIAQVVSAVGFWDAGDLAQLHAEKIRELLKMCQHPDSV